MRPHSRRYLVHALHVCLEFNSSADATGPAMIDFDLIAWDDEDNPRGNVQHIAANGLTIEEVEQVLHDPANQPTVSRSTGRPAVFGATATGKDVFVVYEVLETEPVIVIRPITAYEPMSE
jgi:uncharacterized DUF497 family protein